MAYKTIDNHGVGTGASLKVWVARNLPKPIKVGLRMRDNVAQTQDELLTWVKNLNPVLNTEHWKVLDRQTETKGQRLILHIDLYYKEYRIPDLYMTLTGNCQGPDRSRSTTRSWDRHSILEVGL
jgi:hypothetical protein